MISITATNVTKRFGDTLALDRVDLAVGQGEIFFLLGPSGCGKTTLLRTIAGFYEPEEGRILFGNDDVTRVPPHQRNTGMMFQSYALWPHMTVAKNVAFGLEERKVAKDETDRRVHEALASVKMEQYAGRRIHQLSGGQQQRIALARALVIRPRCLLLDEPLSNLDAKLRLEMRGEIRRICKESGLTAIYVTHDQKEALSIGDRIALMESGVIRQIGTPQEIYRRPHSRFVADFIGETNIVRGKVTGALSQTANVLTPIGAFTGVISKPGWVPQKDTEVLLSIRPESLSLRAGPATTNSVKGRIGESVYLGEMAQHQFTAGDIKLKIYELNPQPRDTAAEIHACVAPDDVVVLPE
ncbi:MAG TPA: ABC transporter ATP-binding protein [Chthoniobacteraceae bacterium]|nr:ABC transporter ATP-binding protein [Chthoniobacteraceae bacterium]